MDDLSGTATYEKKSNTSSLFNYAASPKVIYSKWKDHPMSKNKSNETMFAIN